MLLFSLIVLKPPCHTLQKAGQAEPRTSCSLLFTELTSGGFLRDLADKGATKEVLQLIFSPLAVGNMNMCYVLDGILILYGIILTVLYCRLRISPASKAPASHPEKPPAEGGIYAGLTSHSTDTYETIKIDKKPIV
ncbi:Fc receptor, IgE, high affinity I, gamma polypeptide like [Pempheris klunzingeri]|uniref:Fc receptor, IgE, high affinity I, gamma polypeptide like n=1 Tax=Pempheris klunzingeri TaxID=3127111 RepID=UPI00397F43EC